MGARGRSTKSRRTRQREFWTIRYTEDPSFFGRNESAFSRWCAPILKREKAVSNLIDLGCGYGRDARFFAGRGYRVQAVDLVSGTIPPISDAPSTRRPVEFVRADALGFLQERDPGSIDAVYSNMFLNMDFTVTDHRALFRAILRAVRSGGHHLYSARSTSDPWYGRGVRVGPDTYDLAPDGTTMHFFSREYADQLSRAGFDHLARLETSEGEGEFPIRLLYAVDRKRA